MSIQKQFIATKALIVRDGKMLLLQESTEYKDGTNAGKWDVPGGRVDKGQHFAESLAREIQEECGLSLKSYKPVHVDEWRPTVRGEEWQIVGIYFLCEVEPGEAVLSKDHTAFDWVPLDQLDDGREYNSGVRNALEYLK